MIGLDRARPTARPCSDLGRQPGGGAGTCAPGGDRCARPCTCAPILHAL